jgi:hypothetical protein
MMGSGVQRSAQALLKNACKFGKSKIAIVASTIASGTLLLSKRTEESIKSSEIFCVYGSIREPTPMVASLWDL